MSHSLINSRDVEPKEDPSNTLSFEESDSYPPINDTERIKYDWLTFRRRCELCKQRKVRCDISICHFIETFCWIISKSLSLQSVLVYQIHV